MLGVTAVLGRAQATDLDFMSKDARVLLHNEVDVAQRHILDLTLC